MVFNEVFSTILLINIKEDFPLSKISLVFGCGGNRDENKRSMMGSIAENYCENVYINLYYFITINNTYSKNCYF